MKIAILCVLVTLALAGPSFRPQPVGHTPSERNVLDIIGGVLEGVAVDLEVEGIAQCIEDA